MNIHRHLYSKQSKLLGTGWYGAMPLAKWLISWRHTRKRTISKIGDQRSLKSMDGVKETYKILLTISVRLSILVQVL